MHDFLGDQMNTEKPGNAFELNAAFDEVKAEGYAVLYLPGRCSEYLLVDEYVLDMVKHIDDAFRSP